MIPARARGVQQTERPNVFAWHRCYRHPVLQRMTTRAVQHAVNQAFREERGRVVATLILQDRRLGPSREVRAGGVHRGAAAMAGRQHPAAPRPPGTAAPSGWLTYNLSNTQPLPWAIRAVYRTMLSWTVPLSWAFTSYRHWPFHCCSSPQPAVAEEDPAVNFRSA